MRSVQDIYAHYRIMPGLQMHQLRVAAVGSVVSEHIKKPVNAATVVLAGLFHDMGNIIKSDLGRFPQFLEPEGRPYWEEVKAEYVKTYGADEHVASMRIGEELQLSEAVLACIRDIGFSKVDRIAGDVPYELKIVEYADQRVSPLGVVSMEERIREGRERYEGRVGYLPDPAVFEEKYAALRDIEAQLFESSSIRPEDITEEAVAPIVERLRALDIDAL